MILRLESGTRCALTLSMQTTSILRMSALILTAGLFAMACDFRAVPGGATDGGAGRDSTTLDWRAQVDQVPRADQAPPPAPCNTNAHCAKTEYCHLDQGCVPVGGKIGQCRKRPQNWTSQSDPVCGCDGKTHGNPCAARWAGSNIAYKGKCLTCVELSTEYSKAIPPAMNCCSTCSKPQCTYKVKTNLICPCYTYVDTANTTALTAMQQALAKWTAQQCKEMDCGMSCGPEPKGAICAGSPAGGTCKNTF